MSKTGSAPAAPLNRKQQSRVQREAGQRRLIVLGAMVVAGLVAAIILAGVFDFTVLRPRQVVARVGDTNITQAQFVKAAKFQRYQIISRYLSIYEQAQFFAGDPSSEQFFQQQLAQIGAPLSDPNTLGQNAIDSLVEDQLIRREASARGITVSPEELEIAYQEYLGFYPNGTPTPTHTPTLAPTQTPTAVDLTAVAQLTAAPTLTITLTPSPTFTPTATLTATNTAAPTLTSTPGPSPTATGTRTPRPTPTAYTTQGFGAAASTQQVDVRQQTGLSAADFRYLIEAQLYREKLGEQLGATVATTGQQARVRHILVDNVALAQVILEQLKAGGDFAALAAQYSLDTSNKDLGGELGWIKPGATVATFDAVAFTLPVGSLSDPVQTDFGFHIIEVQERAERELDASELEQARAQALADWLAAQRALSMPDGRPLVEVFDNWLDDVPDTPRLGVN